MPPIHKSVPGVSSNEVSASVPFGGLPVDHINFYKADINDGVWTLIASVTATNGAFVIAPPTSQAWFSTAVYTAETTNSTMHYSSDFSGIVTNTAVSPANITLTAPPTPIVLQK